MLATAGLFGSFLPIVYTKILHIYGQKITLLCHGGGILILTTCALTCIGHRVPPGKNLPTLHTPRRYSFWNKPSFYLLGLSVFVQALAYNLPAIFLPSFITELKYKPTQGAIALSMFNLATSMGQIGFGYLAYVIPSSSRYILILQ